MAKEKFERVKTFARETDSPLLLIDLKTIRYKYQELRRYFPYAAIYYAVTANPHDEVIGLLKNLGSSFDVASRFELDQLILLGVSPDHISYGNTIKKRKDILYSYERGVRLFATDSVDDLNNISDYAPGSKVFFRLISEGLGADRPLSRKFGTHPDLVRQLIKLAVRSGLEPYGISFHPGSQQRDVGQWSAALTTVGQLFRTAKEEIHVDLKMVDMGGVGYRQTTSSPRIRSQAMRRASGGLWKTVSAPTCPKR
jgi:ornithine decarboxylase